MPIPFRALPRFYPGDEGDLWYRAPNGDLVALPIPADYAAQRAAQTPYRVSVDDATGLPYWEATTASAAAFVPTFIAIGSTFTVPADKQALFAETIDNEGILDVVGSLIMVD